MSDQPGVRFALADASQVNALGRPDHLVESSSGGTRLSLLGPKAKSDKMEHFLDLADGVGLVLPNLSVLWLNVSISKVYPSVTEL